MINYIFKEMTYQVNIVELGDYMNEKFFDLKREKQDRIINGALEVFAKSSYKHASTDRIIEIAEISKGLLFHYFGSKEGVYNFLYDYSIRFVELELYGTISIKETNFFELLRQVEEANFKIREKHFYMLAFLLQAEQEEDPNIKKIIRNKTKHLQDYKDKIFENANMNFLSRFENQDFALKIMRYCLDGFDLEHEKSNANSMIPWKKEKREYINLLENIMTNT